MTCSNPPASKQARSCSILILLLPPTLIPRRNATYFMTIPHDSPLSVSLQLSLESMLQACIGAIGEPARSEKHVFTDDDSFCLWCMINSGAVCLILSSDVKVALAFVLTSEL